MPRSNPLWHPISALAHPTEESTRLRKLYSAYAVLFVTILAPVLGGSTTLWARAVLAIAIGLLLIVWPPRRSLGWIPNCLFLTFLALALVGFLPAYWFSIPQWRTDLLQLGAVLPGTHSPQPWLTLQWTCLLLMGLAWSYYVLGFRWDHRLRQKACVIYAVAILCLSATRIFAWMTKQRIPFWPETERFGFFPNRNQTSNVLGLGGIMIYALGLQSLQENRRYWWWWPVSLSVVCWALILNFSRAGIILFFFGALALHFYWWRSAQDRQRPVAAIGGLILLFALFLINGGATLARFGHETSGLLSEAGNLRWLIYKDATHLLATAPLGIGLGNFRSIFAFNRLYSALPSEAVHPESDWLWTTIELGWLAPFLLILLLWWWLRRCAPFDPGSMRLLRMAALICGCAFILHGFVDVSGHRPGALWPALFLGSIAVHPDVEFKISKWIPPLFRFFGLILVLIGLWWMSSFFGGTTLPTTASEDELRHEITSAIDKENYTAVRGLADAGLQIAPLDWLLYYKRGVAEIALANPRQSALRDFGIANYLYPLWPDLYLDQGVVWLAAGEVDLAFDVWKEGLRRAEDKSGSLYSRILSAAGRDPEMRDRLRELIDDNHVYLILFLRSATPFEFQIEKDRLLSNDPLLHSFSPNELEQIFSSWYEKGDELELAENLRAHPDWLKIGWKQLARVYADYQEYRGACETVLKFDPPPNLPATNSDESFEKLAARFQVNQGDIDNGLALYQAQIKNGQIDSALVTLQKLGAVEGRPKYLSYLEAQLWAQSGQWKNAWEAVAKYEFGGK